MILIFFIITVLYILFIALIILIAYFIFRKAKWFFPKLFGVTFAVYFFAFIIYTFNKPVEQGDDYEKIRLEPEIALYTHGGKNVVLENRHKELDFNDTFFLDEENGYIYTKELDIITRIDYREMAKYDVISSPNIYFKNFRYYADKKDISRLTLIAITCLTILIFLLFNYIFFKMRSICDN